MLRIPRKVMCMQNASMSKSSDLNGCAGSLMEYYMEACDAYVPLAETFYRGRKLRAGSRKEMHCP